MKYCKRYLACFLAMLMVLGSVNVGSATNVTISTEDLNPESEEITNQSDQLETNTISGNSIEENILSEEEISDETEISSDSNIQLTTENDDLEPSETDSELDDEVSDNWELELVFYDSTVDDGKTPLTEINWNATTNETRIITVQINYKNENVTRTYEQGDLKIQIPNLGQRAINANETNVYSMKADSYFLRTFMEATDISAGDDSDFYDWNYQKIGRNTFEYINNTKISSLKLDYFSDYLFSNNNLIEEGSSINGSLQIKYKFSSGQILQTDNFNIKASINNIDSNSINFSFSSNKFDFKNSTLSVDNITSFDGMPINSNKYIWIKYCININGNGIRGLNDYRLYVDKLSENVILLDNSLKEINLENNIFIPNFSEERKIYCYIGYPITEFENETITQTFKLLGNYCDNKHTSETHNSDMECLLELNKENININDFKFNFNSMDGTSIKLTGGDADKISYGMLIKGMCRQIVPIQAKTPYLGYEYNVRIGYDMVGGKDFNNNFAILDDDEYYLTHLNIGTPQNYNGISYKNDTYTYDVFLRYENESEYTLYGTYQKQTSISFTSKKVVAFYVEFHNLNEGFICNLTTQLFTRGIGLDKNLKENGSIYSFGYIQRYIKDNDYYILDGIVSEDLYGSGMQQIAEYDLSHYGNYLLRGYKIANYNNTEKFSIYGFNNILNKVDNIQKEQIEYIEQIGAQIYWWTSNYVEKINGFKFYTLLPEGVILNGNENDIIKTAMLNENIGLFAEKNEMTKNEMIEYLSNHTNVIIKENWNNTNRTKIDIIMDFRDNPLDFFDTYFATGNMSFTVKLPIAIPYDSIQEYGELYSTTSYVDAFEGDGYIIMPSAYLSQVFTDVMDIDEDGNTTEKLAAKTANISIVHAIASHKDVNVYAKTDNSNYSVGTVESSLNTNYTYKLRVRTGGNNSITNLVIYDNIEQAFGNNEYWNGEFLNIDTSYAESKGYQVKVYYSENKNTGALSEDDSWKEYFDSVDKSKVKSLAFEYLDSEGNKAVIPQNSLTYVLINMKSINNNRIKSLAYNNFSATWNEINQYGTVSDTSETLISNIVKISLPNSDKFGSYKINHQYYLKDIDGNLVLENEVEELSDDILIDTIINIKDVLVIENQDKTYSYLGDLESFIIEEDIQKEITLSYVRDMEKPSHQITQMVEVENDSNIIIKGNIENITETENMGLKNPEIIISVDKDLKINSVKAEFTDKDGNKISLTEDMYYIDEENNTITFIFGDDDKILNGNSFSYEIETIVINGDENGNKDTVNTEVKLSGYLITEGEETSFWIENIEDEIFNIELQQSAKVKESSITINPNGGSYNNSTNETKLTNIKYGTEIELSIPKRNGYTFTGWTISDNSESLLTENVLKIGFKDVELTAKWELDSFDVTYIDIDSNSNELGRQVIKKPYNSVVQGSDLGSDKTDNAYYNGYALDSWTESTVTTDGAIVYRIFIAKTNIVFHLEWNDEDDKDRFRPENYLVSLIVNGEKQKEFVKNSSETSFEIPNLPKEDEEGNPIIYTFEIQTNERYTITYDADRDVYIATYNFAWFSVIIPKYIVLDGTTGTASYNIMANGRFYYDDKLIVVPDANLTLTDKAKISTIHANVTQDKTLINLKENLLSGNIATEEKVFPGEWRGFFNFEIKFLSNKKTVAYSMEYLYEDGSIIKTTESRLGKVGDAVFPTHQDLSIEGYVFQKNNPNNISNIILGLNSSENIIRLYFREAEDIPITEESSL